ncbi:hypothetical protein AVEN_240115-1, partial [Araneus ventricosus]
MELNFPRGFVVSSSVVHLDLRESINQSPILFICEEKKLAKSLKTLKPMNENLAETSPDVVYWDYYDQDREAFEIEVFRTFQGQMLQERMDIRKLRKFLKVCRNMSRCTDSHDARGIFNHVSTEIMNFHIELLIELLETVCFSSDVVQFIFDFAGRNDLNFL